MMASPSSELILDCKPHSYSLLLKSFAVEQNQQQSGTTFSSADQTQKLAEFLSRLEEERLKIDAFKRELPLCMQLLTNVVEAYREQLQSCRATHHGGAAMRPAVLEEFIPLKHGGSEGSDQKAAANMSDKANWMTSAQLWSSQTASDAATEQQQPPKPLPKEESDVGIGGAISPKRLALDNNNKHQGNGGAFLPFSKERRAHQQLPELALASSDMQDKKIIMDNNNIVDHNSYAIGVIEQEGKGVHHNNTPHFAESQSTISSNNTNTNTNSNQTHRKARRCWSPDLHRRFVNALQMLGGSQVATPKQIRELMKVDGLTNDEVKSHLQKYRLHTRRPSPSPQAAAAGAPQLVVLGGIWVPPEYATAAHSAGPATLYGAHHPAASPHHYCAPSPVVQHQEFYPSPASQHPHHHQSLHHHHQLHMYKPPSQSSPESNSPRNGGDRSESIEDGKSESSSWKADSVGEIGGERKALVLREDGEESNGSEITLKFKTFS